MPFLLLLIALLATPVASARDLAAQAKKLFAQKRYAEACPLWERATRLAPGEATVWGDLGYCLARQWAATAQDPASPLRASASDALLRSIRLGDERVRKAAYYNLNVLLGWTAADLPGWPQAAEAACSLVRAPAALGCPKPALACVRTAPLGFRDAGEVVAVRLGACESDCSLPDAETTAPRLALPPRPCNGVSGPGVACAEAYAGESCPDDKPHCGSAGGDADRSGCVVVLVDACAGRFAIACGDWGGDRKRKPIFQERPLPP